MGTLFLGLLNWGVAINLGASIMLVFLMVLFPAFGLVVF